MLESDPEIKVVGTAMNGIFALRRIYRDKRTQAQKDFIAGLKGKAKIKIFDSNLKKVRVDTSTADSGGHGRGGGNLPAFPGKPAGKKPGKH